MSAKHSLIVSDSASLVSIPEEVNGRVVTRYFTEDHEAEGSQGRYAFAVIGTAADIDTTDEEMLAQIHRLRHESAPTPLADVDRRGAPSLTPPSSSASYSGGPRR